MDSNNITVIDKDELAGQLELIMMALESPSLSIPSGMASSIIHTLSKVKNLVEHYPLQDKATVPPTQENINMINTVVKMGVQQ